MKCTVCKGTGKQTLHASELVFDYDAKKWVEKPEPPVEIDCVFCKGKGTLTPVQKAVVNYAKNMWCKCKKDYGTTFYDDNVHPVLRKHHYRCKKCGKVKQIG